MTLPLLNTTYRFRGATRVFVASLVSLTFVASYQRAPVQADDALPAERVVLDIDSPEHALYRIAVPNLEGDAAMGQQGAGVLRFDFNLVSLFEILDPRSFLSSGLKGEVNTLDPGPWRAVGAQGVIRGKVTREGKGIRVEAHLFELAKGTDPTLSRIYAGSPNQLRGFMHRFANEVLAALTGKAGAFGSRLTFARKLQMGRKEVFVADSDGHSVLRVSDGTGINLLPSFGPGGIWWTRLDKNYTYITNRAAQGKPVISSNRLDMAPVFCGGRILFVSNRDGNSEIYSAKPDGSDVRRLTDDPGIDVSPACGPGGRIAFVSNRHGTPQIFVMNGDGSGVRRITYRGTYNQTPAWCPDPKKPIIAFTGRSGGMDVYTVNIETQKYTRLTQAQGINKDPAFSPDCRMVAFHSSRGGIFISSPEGLNQQLVIPGHAETIRWSTSVAP